MGNDITESESLAATPSTMVEDLISLAAPTEVTDLDRPALGVPKSDHFFCYWI